MVTRAAAIRSARLFKVGCKPCHFVTTASFSSSRMDDSAIATANLHRRYETYSSLSALVYQGNCGERNHPLTKLVCTIGPASHSLDKIQELVTEGMRVLRINCSHATRTEMEERVRWLRRAKGVHSNVGSTFNLRAVMFDTKGPEIRTGKLVGGSLALERGQKVEVVSSSKASAGGCGELPQVVVDYEGIEQVVSAGQAILLDDGLIELIVIRDDEREPKVVATVQNSGLLGERKGVNIPGCTSLDLPAMTELDKEHLRIACDLDADFVAASFVNKGKDVVEIRNFLESCTTSSTSGNLPPKIIAKIESAEALSNFDDILRESDGIMVARGDLAVEIPFSVVTRAQKQIVRACNAAGKPVIASEAFPPSADD